MALKTGLYLPNSNGLQTGLNTGRTEYPEAGATLLHTIDWTPATFSKTQGAGSLDPDSTATYHWDLEQSGTQTEELVGGGTHDLAFDSGASENTVRTQQTMPGLCNGTNLSSFKAVETAGSINGSSQALISASTDTLNPADGSIAFRFVYRTLGTGATTNAIVGKWDNSAGWYVGSHVTNGISITVDDGTTSVAVQSTGTYQDGGIYLVSGGINWATDTVWLRVGSESLTADISSVVQANSGGTHALTLGGVQSAFSGEIFQVADLWGWTGTAAENLSSDALTDFWNHGADPMAGTIFEDDSISYTGATWAPVGEDLFTAYSGDASQYPIGYTTRLTDAGAPNGFGRYGTKTSRTNLVTESERLENWTTSSASVGSTAAAMIDNVAGFRQARSVTDSGSGGGYVYSASFTPNSRGSSWCFVKTTSGTVDGKLIVWDDVVGAASATINFTANATGWTRVGQYDTFSTANTHHIRLEVTDASGVIHFCGVGVSNDALGTSEGNALGSYIPTFGATAAADNSNGIATFGSNLEIGDAGYTVSYYANMIDDCRGIATNEAVLLYLRDTGGGYTGVLAKQDSANVGHFRGVKEGTASSYDENFTTQVFQGGVKCEVSWSAGGATFGGESCRVKVTDSASNANTEDWTPASDTGAHFTALRFIEGTYSQHILGYIEIYDGTNEDL